MPRRWPGSDGWGWTRSKRSTAARYLPATSTPATARSRYTSPWRSPSSRSASLSSAITAKKAPGRTASIVETCRAPRSTRSSLRELLELRDPHSSQGPDDTRDQLTELGRRGITSYAERAVLTRLSDADWRMGSGSPAPYELLTGAGAMDLVMPSLDVLEELLTGHRRFIFVPTRGHLGLLTIGRALAPLEFVVVHRLRSYIADIVDAGHLRGRRLERAKEFVAGAGESVAVGVFRASSQAPPYVFYAPAEEGLCAQAAAIAIADSVIQEHRGYPMLLEMAKQFCTAAFSREEFLGPIQAAYAARHEPLAPEA